METKSNKKIGAIIGAVVVVCALVMVFFSINAASSNKNVAEQLQLAQSYIDELDYEQAIACLEEIIRIDPKNVDAYLMLADVYVEMEDPASAIEVLTNACKQVQDERLDDALEELSGSAVEEIEGEKEALDPRFEACVVDGIWRAGYKKYDFTQEESMLLSETIRLAQNRDSEAVFKMLESDTVFNICKKYGNYETNENGETGKIRCAFDEYKIYYEQNISSSNDVMVIVCIIPIDDKKGFFFELNYNVETKEERWSRTWGESECKNGMYEGEFIQQIDGVTEDGNIATRIMNGKIKNGFWDGAIREKTPEGTLWEYNFIVGKPQIYEIKDEWNGAFYVCWYGYRIDENGNAIMNSEGEYLENAGYIFTQEQIETARLCWGTILTGYEVEGGMVYYPY